MIPFNTELEQEELDKLVNGRYSVVLPNIKEPKFTKGIDGPFGTRYEIEKRFGYFNGEWWYQIAQWNKTGYDNEKQFTYYACESDLENFIAAIKLSKSEQQLREEARRAAQRETQDTSTLEKIKQKKMNDLLQQHIEAYKKQKEHPDLKLKPWDKSGFNNSTWNTNDFDTNKFGEW